MSTLAGFRKELESLVNRHSMESGSNTPDFILAEYLTDCLAAFDKALHERTRWYTKAPPPDQPSPDQPDLRRESVKGRVE